MKTVLYGRINRRGGSGGFFTYLPRGAANKLSSIFKSGDVVKLEVDQKSRRLVMSVPIWWEMVDFNQATDLFNALDPKQQQIIRAAGRAPSRQPE